MSAIGIATKGIVHKCKDLVRIQQGGGDGVEVKKDPRIFYQGMTVEGEKKKKKINIELELEDEDTTNK